MGSVELNPIELMVAVIRDHSPESIWTGSPLEGYRHVGNTNRGEQSITFKLTKKLDDLRPIEELAHWVRTTMKKDA